MYPSKRKDGYKRMSKHLFSSKAVAELKEHPYVEFVNTRQIRFTAGFKQLAFEEMSRGKPVNDVFREAGLDPAVIGDKRIEHFRANVELQAERDGGFTDRRSDNHRHEAQTIEARQAQRIRELEHRLAYLEQENDFLKKIQQAEKDFDGKAVNPNCSHKPNTR